MNTQGSGKRKVLLVDDDPGLLRVLSMRLQREGYDVTAAENGNRALAMLSGVRPDVVVTDMRMDGMDGLNLFDEIRTREPTLPVILLTAHGTIPDAVDATERGIFAYLTKPFDKQQLLQVIDRAASLFARGDQAVPQDAGWRKEMVTHCDSMEVLLREAWLVAQSDSSVLIRGESGTGKELLARAIHAASSRAELSLIPVNCSAIPEHLLEAELFGHRKGAFTGATHAHSGLIQAADQGTLFLDEIGDMPLHLQAKLLRVLEEKEIRPVGSTATVQVDVRVISATHQNLEQAIVEKRFREDLYYRLNVVSLEIPSLSERRQDIPLLVDHFLAIARERKQKQKQEHKVEVQSFSNEALELLLSVNWPGNVRQLRNVVEQCVALATTPVIPTVTVERALKRNSKAFLPFSDARDRFELEYLTDLLQMTKGKVSQAARLAERNRSQFYKLLSKHSLEPELFRNGYGGTSGTDNTLSEDSYG